jgi:two-component system alkaline phosphatase synthesis response regulator PhoP
MENLYWREYIKMIFCVEDDSGIRELMIYTLNSAGFEARGFVCGNDFFEALKKEIPQLVMLDIMLPDEDGIEILKRLKSNTATADIPIIMATAKGTEYDKVIGLDLGADDYLAKPFGMMEMVSRVKAVLRRTMPKKEISVLKVGGLELNTIEHTVSANGMRIVLTLKEYELLYKFMDNLGRVFTREQLLQSIWGSDYVGETRTVDVHIGTLRSKLGECGDYIETVRGVGYRMEARL